jgi:uncharacterized PurR-regulated membrane protein YhhQ (DUF165 family)
MVSRITLNTIVIPSFFMIMIISISNHLVEIQISPWLTWGAFSYPFTFLVTELTNRFYGPEVAQRVVYVGFVTAILLTFNFMNERIATASCLAFLVGQLLDIYVFNYFRNMSWWVAPGIASITASLVDTLIFFSVAFGGQQIEWVSLAIGDFIVKLGMDLCLLLPFRFLLMRQWWHSYQ